MALAPKFDNLMEWPSQLTLVRHARSAYNETKHKMSADAQYLEFGTQFVQDPASQKSIDLARSLHATYPSTRADLPTPLAHGGMAESIHLGRYLRATLQLPEVVFVSPYVRTWATLAGILQGWPELDKVRVIEEERIREQEFGQRLAYMDRDVYLALHPDQQQLFASQGPYWYRWPQGENIPDVRSRLRSWATTLTRDYAGKPVLALTHHITILAWRANIERLTANQFLHLEQTELPANSSVTCYADQRISEGNHRLTLQSYADLPNLPVDPSNN